MLNDPCGGFWIQTYTHKHAFIFKWICMFSMYTLYLHTNTNSLEEIVNSFHLYWIFLAVILFCFFLALRNGKYFNGQSNLQFLSPKSTISTLWMNTLLMGHLLCKITLPFHDDPTARPYRELSADRARKLGLTGYLDTFLRLPMLFLWQNSKMWEKLSFFFLTFLFSFINSQLSYSNIWNG